MLKQFLWFGTVGAAGFAVDVAVLYGSLWGLGLGYLSARLLSFLTAATFTWYLNRSLTFADCDRSSPRRQLMRFLAVNSLGGALNFLVYGIAMLGFTGDAWRPLLAVAMGSISGLALNFFASRRLVFAVSVERD
jgi:putative flippase GtrA